MKRLASSVTKLLRNEITPYFRHPDKKPLSTQMRDIFRLWRYWKYVPYHYLTHQLYAKGASDDVLRFIPPALIRRIQRSENTGPQLEIARHKRKFEAHMVAHGLRCITPSWLVTADGRLLDAQDREVSFEEFRAASHDVELFAKPVRGGEGRGIRALDAGHLTSEQLAGMANTLIQPRVRQHPDISRIYPHALNTIRIDTFLDGDLVHHTGAALRIGAGGATSDNWSTGGLAVGIDLETGRLFKRSYRKSKFPQTPFLYHPDSGIAFDSYQLPFWPEVMELVERAARTLPDLHCLCWDVGIAEDGPLLVETNDLGGMNILQIPRGGIADSPLGRHAARKHGLRHG